jgi:hypothetical protein
MHDLGPLAAEQPDELGEPGEIAQRVDRPAHVAERDEASSGLRGCCTEELPAVRGNGHVEVLGERRQERGDVRLRAAHFAERDHEQNARPVRVAPG